MTARRFFAAGKTGRFDAVAEAIIVTKHIDGVSTGNATAADSPAPVAPDYVVPAGAGSELRAYRARPGVTYRVEGLEFVPRAVVRYVRFDESLGFVEVAEGDFRPSPQPETATDGIRVGTPAQIEWACKIRSRFEVMLNERADADRRAAAALPKLRSIASARWFIARKDLGFADALREIEDAE